MREREPSHLGLLLIRGQYLSSIKKIAHKINIKQKDHDLSDIFMVFRRNY